MTHRASLSQCSCDTRSLKKYIILTDNLDNCVFFLIILPSLIVGTSNRSIILHQNNQVIQQ